MAEVIGLAASIIALGGAAMTAAKLADSMIRVARRVHGAQEDIENFANDISAWAVVIGLAHRAIKHHTSKESSQSAVLQFMADESVLEQLLRQTQQVIRDVRKVRKPIRNLDSPIKIWPRIKWILQRKDVAALGLKMESLKTSLSIVIHVVHMEAAQRQGDKDEIKELKQQIKILNNTIQVLLERRYISLDFFNVQEILLELGENMAEYGTVEREQELEEEQEAEMEQEVEREEETEREEDTQIEWGVWGE